MSTIRLDIITPLRAVYSEDVDSVFVPTPNGTIGVLPKHIPLFTSLSEGEIKIISGSKEKYLAIGGGFMEVTKEKISILVSRAYHAHELNEAEIKKAQTAAKEILSKKAKGVEYADAQALLRRSVLEMKVLHRVKHRDLPTLSS